jgi:hypothetical protein
MNLLLSSVAEPHHFNAALDPAQGENFDAAPYPAAPYPAAIAPTLLYSKTKFGSEQKMRLRLGNTGFKIPFSSKKFP